MRAATTPLERVRRQALPATFEHVLRGAPDWVTYEVDELVWCFFGQRGLQLARVRMKNPVAFERGGRWYWVDVWWPTRGRWTSTHRRVLRALAPAELSAVHKSGVTKGRPT